MKTACHRGGLLRQMLHVAWSAPVFVLATLIYCAITAEPIEMPFAGADSVMWTRYRLK